MTNAMIKTATTFGPYRLQGLIGRGGMGEVHRAVDTAHDGRVVALKLLPPDVVHDPARRARFRREAEIVAGLGEPHVVPVHGYGELDDRLYLDMQLVDGPDLAEYLIASGPLPPALAVAIVEQVAAALDAAHAAGLVHHDVKPSNVLVHRPVAGQLPHVLLADFGIAGDSDGLGTVEYLAPERIRGLPGDHRVDVYALACVLFELLTGARAFPGGEPAAQMYGHLHRRPPRPSTLVGAVPPDLDAVLGRGMAKNPEDRQATAGAFAAAARSALADGRRVSRRSVLLAAAAGVLTVGSGLAAAGAFRGPATALGIPAAGKRTDGVITERALGIRTADRTPFIVAAVGDTIMAVVQDDKSFQGWDLRADMAVGPRLPRGVAPLGGLGVSEAIASDLGSTALIDVDGVPVLCACTFSSPEVAMLDLRTGRVVRPAFTPTGGQLRTLTATVIGGAPVLIAVDREHRVARTDLRTGRPLGPPVAVPALSDLSPPEVVPLSGRTGLSVQPGLKITERVLLDAATVTEIGRFEGLERAITELDGRIVVVGAWGVISIRDLATGRSVRQIPAPTTFGVTVAVIGGRPVAVAGSETGELTLHDLVGGVAIGTPLTGHTGQITAMRVVALGERPVLVTAAQDNAMRVWDLAVHANG